MWRSLFPTKEISVQVELFGDFLYKWSILTHENSPHSFISTELRFSKFSVVSVFSNWLYNSERKAGNTVNLQLFKNFEFFFRILKDSTYISQNKDFNSLNFNKTQINWINNHQKTQINPEKLK